MFNHPHCEHITKHHIGHLINTELLINWRQNILSNVEILLEEGMSKVVLSDTYTQREWESEWERERENFVGMRNITLSHDIWGN